MVYGIGYKGSKSKIAKDIVQALPAGKRLVDLFGGGFAITHCAMVEHPEKWGSFLCSDIDPLLKPLLEDAIAGKYSYDNFKPEWISREEFHKRKHTDGYIKWCWSFGNNGNDYLYGREKEPVKKAVHQYIVFNEKSPLVEGIELKAGDIKARRLEYIRQATQNVPKKHQVQQLERLERVQQLEHLNRPERLANLERLDRLQNLESLERLANLEIKTMSYKDYEYKEGDVVYCDIPYKDSTNSTDYGGGFDHEAFFQWAKSRPYKVYYSSYTKGTLVWQKKVGSVMNSAGGRVKRNEALLVI